MMQQYVGLLGKKVRDKITGVEGIVTSVCFDLYGCVQVIIKRPADKDGKLPESFWHDVKRVETIVGKQVMPTPDFRGPLGTEPGPEEKPVPEN